MITFSMNKFSTRRKPQHRLPVCTVRQNAVLQSTTSFNHVTCAMPELAEVEWFRKQWNPGCGHEIIDLSLHPRNRVFRGTSTNALRENLLGRKLLKSATHGKQMLFSFSADNWLPMHLGMTAQLGLD